MKRLAVLVATLIGAMTGVAPPASAGFTTRTDCALPVFGPGATYHPVITAAMFGPNVDNPWFPLRPGTTYVYTGTKDNAAAVDVFAVSARTQVIDGVTTRVVHDRLYLDGVLEERTTDYYAQDRCGNVWYFGEDTAQLDARGKVVARDGTWRAGVAGAQPGVFMQAAPQIGRSFRQEWLAGQAEDVFSVIGFNQRVSVPYGTFHHAMRTSETTELEPDVLDNKLYVIGIGEVQELSVKGPTEKLSLVDVLR
jgi:hypothetical protein